MTNSEIEDEVLKRLPATYGALCKAFGEAGDRRIDAALQRLRRRGEISFKRDGQFTVWNRCEKQ